MLRLSIEIEGTRDAARPFEDLAQRLEKSPRNLLAQIAEDWATRVFPDLFERGGDPPWEPLSPLTTKIHGSTRPLEGDGDLRRSLRVLELDDFEAQAGSEIGAVHQTGGTTAPGSLIPNAEIPARPFVSLTESEIEKSVERIFDFFLGDS